MRVSCLLTLGILVIAGCSSVTRPPADDGVGNFRIVLDQRPFVEEGGTLGILATVTNVSTDQDFYANVGDGINAALDQPTIYAANGTHAVLERRVSAGVWTDANAAQLIEGSRFVVLKAGKSYQLVGSIARNAPGTYRIRLDYSATNEDPAPSLPFHDYSATFVVR